MSTTGRVFDTRDATFDAFARHVSKGKVTTYRELGFDVVMGERDGIHFRDAFDGRELINCHVNGGVFNLGHKNPRVVARVIAALAEVDIGNHHLVSGYRALLAERLAKSTADLLPGVVFASGGGEATDLAIKVARAVTGRSKIVSALGGYHGHTGLALAAGDAQYRDAFGANLPGFVQVPFDDLAALERTIDTTTAAVVLEPIPATLGMPIPAPDYLPRVALLCRERGAKLVLDEVQTGLGRTGRMWCHQHDDVKPDAMIIGKGLSGGVYPIAATLLSRELFALFDTRPFIHISTFGGAEPGCAAALEVLEIVEEPGFLDHVNQLATRFARGFSGLPFQLRQRGLMMGLAFAAENAGMLAAKLLLDRGVFAVYANNDRRVLQFLPPLTITDAEADELIGRVREAFGG